MCLDDLLFPIRGEWIKAMTEREYQINVISKKNMDRKWTGNGQEKVKLDRKLPHLRRVMKWMDIGMNRLFFSSSKLEK